MGQNRMKHSLHAPKIFEKYYIYVGSQICKRQIQTPKLSKSLLNRLEPPKSHALDMHMDQRNKVYIEKYLEEQRVSTLHTYVQNVSCTQLICLTKTHNRHTPDRNKKQTHKGPSLTIQIE